MPHYVPRKRTYSPAPPQKRTGAVATSSPVKGKVPAKPKAGLVDVANTRGLPTPAEATKKLLEQLNQSDDSSLGDADSSSSNDESSGPRKRRKVEAEAGGDSDSDADGSGVEEEPEENEWDDFLTSHARKEGLQEDGQDDTATDRIEVTLDKAPQHTRVSVDPSGGKKKGPSKRERQIRTSTHCLHVQYLLYHNFIRNVWTCNKDVQKKLVGGLTEGCKEEVKRWRDAVKQSTGSDVQTQDTDEEVTSTKKGKGAKVGKKPKSQRDWGHGANTPKDQDAGGDQSDPTLRLLQTLSSYWKKKFVVTAPGLRKQGYKTMERLREQSKQWRDAQSDEGSFGERVESLSQFKEQAKKAEGSRDLGAQLFVAMLRGLGLEVRLVSNLQPAGFGWSKAEDAEPSIKKAETVTKAPKKKQDSSPNAKSTPAKAKAKSTPSRSQPKRTEKKKRSGGAKDAPMDLSDEESPLSSPPSSDSEESVVDITHTRPIPQVKRFDRDLPFPVYWAEVLSPITQRWIPVDPIVLGAVSGKADTHCAFEPRGAQADRAKQVLAYAVVYSADNTAKDVTTRYLKKQMWPGKTKGFRLPIEKIPIYNKHGKIRKHEDYDWFKHVMSGYARSDKKRTAVDDLEDNNELKPVRIQREATNSKGEETLQGYKNSAEFVLERHLRREEALVADAKPVKTFWTGKGDTAVAEPVYRRVDVVVCRTTESWHKEGREVKEGEQPLKHVPMRAVTTIRKREIEEAERESGEKMKQGLYARDQTDWIIPPPIEDGIIPKNAFGNMDVYVPTMVPKGAVHVALRGTARICRRIGIEHAEACTGFEFGNRRAVPVLTGVVVAAENKKLLVDAWRVDDAEKKKKEQVKREKLVLGTWKKMLAGLRVIERVRREYGDDAQKHIEEAVKAQTSKKGRKKGAPTKKNQASEDDNIDLTMDLEDEGAEVSGYQNGDYNMPGGKALGGGFFPEGMNVELLDRKPLKADDADTGGGGFVLEEDEVDDPHTKAGEQNTGLLMSSLRQRMGNDVETENPDAAQEHAGAESDDPEDTEGHADGSYKKSKTPATRGRGQGRGRGRKHAVENKDGAGTTSRKRPLPSPDSESEADDKHEDVDETIHRSKYFESSAESEHDDDKSFGNGSARKKAKRTSATNGAGRGRGKHGMTGRGRGRGKWKA